MVENLLRKGAELMPEFQKDRETMEKALGSESPSAFFRALRHENRLHARFFELEALIGVEQDPVFHPEGDVWEHTMLVLDTAAQLRKDARKPLEFMLSALCHDFGKPAAWQLIDGHIRALGHEKQGIEPAKAFLSRFGYEVDVQDYVANMVQLHMRPNLLAAQNSGDKAACRLFRASVCPEDLLLLSKADRTSRPGAVDYTETERYLREKLALFYEKK